MTRYIGICAALIACIASAPTAIAADKDTCWEFGNPGAVAACTRMINSGRFRGVDLADIYEMRGVGQKMAEKYDEAIADYTRALELNPKEARLFSNRGNSWRLKGDIDRAMTDLTQAIRLDATKPTIYVVRGVIWQYNKDDQDRAIEDFTHAIRLDPAATSAFTNRAVSFEKKGDFVRARADYLTALSLPEKYSDGKWAHDKARERLDAMKKDNK